MDIEALFKDKTIKPKERTETISQWLLAGSLTTKELLEYASKAKDPVKATCIEAIEFASKQQPVVADISVLDFVTNSLTEKAPRIKWESAKVIGNIAHRYPAKLDAAISNLIINTEHDGTVVRWSAAYALGEIIKIKKDKDLLTSVEAICDREEKNSIKKIYLSALKVAKKPAQE